MADRDAVPEADALDQALPASDADPGLIGVDDEPEIDAEVPEADAVEQSRRRAVPAEVARRPMPLDAPEHDVLDQRLAAGDEDDEDDFR
jgi:hypothetical protein